MTSHEFYKKAEEIISSDAPANDPVCGKDRLLGDLLIQAYPEDIKIPVLGDTVSDDRVPEDLEAFNFLIKDMKLQSRMTGGVLCYTSPDTAAERKEIDQNAEEVEIQHILDMVYTFYNTGAIIFNFGMEGKEVIIQRDQLTRWLTPYVRRELRQAQSYAKSVGTVPRNANMPFLR